MKIALDKIRDFSLDKKKITLTILVIVIFLILDFYFILGMQVKANKAIDIKIKKLKEDFKRFKEDYSLMQEALKKTRKQTYKIINENELSYLIEEMSRLAQASNIEISQIKPQKEIKSTVSVSGIVPYLFYLNLNSNYFSLLKFIKGLEEHPVIISVDELQISQNPNNIFRHNINLTLKVYVKK